MGYLRNIGGVAPSVIQLFDSCDALSSSPRMKGQLFTKVLFIYRRKRRERLSLYKKGVGPDDAFHGLTHFDWPEFNVGFVEGDDTKWNFWRRLCYPFEVLVSRRLGIGFAIHIILAHLVAIKQADVLISTVDTCGLPIAMLKYLRILNKPLIYISQGLGDRLGMLPEKSISHWLFRSLYGKFLRCAEMIIVLGEGSGEPLVKYLRILPDRISCLPFGVDEKFWTPDLDSNPAGFILSIGSDPSRDYRTLLEAGRNEWLKIVTHLNLNDERLSQRIDISSKYSDTELRDLYRKARFVVTPLKNVTQPSGQTTTLQAMACGKAVILSDTVGLWDRKRMRHLENCYLVEPENVENLREAISFLKSHPEEADRIGRNARSLVEECYSSRVYGHGLQQAVMGLCSWSGRS
jgi:glycosyltransferase involved in cell wall biosynthesis